LVQCRNSLSFSLLSNLHQTVSSWSALLRKRTVYLLLTLSNDEGDTIPFVTLPPCCLELQFEDCSWTMTSHWQCGRIIPELGLTLYFSGDVVFTLNATHFVVLFVSVIVAQASWPSSDWNGNSSVGLILSNLPSMNSLDPSFFALLISSLSVRISSVWLAASSPSSVFGSSSTHSGSVSAKWTYFVQFLFWRW